MKKYSSKRAKRGKTAYRTPSVFRYQKIKQIKQTFPYTIYDALTTSHINT